MQSPGRIRQCDSITRPPRGASRASRTRSGLTLTEVVVSGLFVGMLIVAALRVTESVYRMRLAAAELNDAHLLGEELMSETLQSPYKDPGGPVESGSPGSRAEYDDLDDYNGWTSTPPKQKDGTPLSGFAGWQRSVSVVLAQPADPNAVSGTDQGLKRITVTVTSPAGKTFTWTALRAERGMLELKPPVNAAYVAHGTVTLQPAGGNSRRGGAPLSNHAQDAP